MKYKLGKRPARRYQTRFRFEDVFDTSKLPPLPAGPFGHYTSVPENNWGMFGNDQVGDCVFAGAAHEEMLWSGEIGAPEKFTTKGVLSDYSAVTGYVPGDASTDQGTDVQTALNYRIKTGVIDASGTRRKLIGAVPMQIGNWTQLLYAIRIFGAVGLGVDLPDSAEDQFENEMPWDVVKGARSEGGHYIPAVGHNSKNNAVLITWGRDQAMTQAWYEEYNDEAYALLSSNGLNKAGLSPEGFDLQTLSAYLKEFTS